MLTRVNASILGGGADKRRLHRRVVHVGAILAWFTTALFLLIGFAVNSSEMYVHAIGPSVAAVLLTGQIVLRREHAGVALGGAAVITVVMNATVGNEDTLIPAAVALVVIPVIGMLFVNSNKTLSVIGAGLLVVAAAFTWGLPFYQALSLGLIMGISFVISSTLFIAIRSAAEALDERFKTLFEHSPTAMLEEDWSEAIAYVRSEFTGRPDRIEPFLMSYPAVVKRAVARARVIRVNRAALKLLEAENPDDVLGYRDPSLVSPATMDLFVGALVGLYEGKTFLEQETPAQTFKGSSIWLQTRYVDASNGVQATNILVGLADITHMKAHSEAMTELVKAKDEFVASVSHELRTPLTAVIGLTSELASMDGLSEAERVEMMHLVAGQAADMSHIVDDLLVAARAEIGTVGMDFGVVDLQAEIESSVDGLALPDVTLPEAAPSVIADPSRVRQILRNLLVNAGRYGGPQVEIRAGTTGDRAWLEVRDDGDGVPAEQVTHIFDPYSTAHAGGVTGSVGLGLSVARQLTELMDGSLTYHRDADESVFRLELPLAHSNSAVLASKKALV